MEDTTYQFKNNKHTLLRTYNFTLGNDKETYQNTAEFSYVSLKELAEIAKGPNNQDNDRNIQEIVNLIKNSTIESRITGIYLDTTFGSNWGDIYFELNEPFIDNTVTHFLSSLHQASADEISFELPNLIRAWWD